ncbi:MAG: UDP-N-acetylmuramate dehydrogenase [Clostridiales bacterium]|nr:UDP-N-acetylmuramate dehydrogenase [Clostridiales bacterium]
MEDLFLDKLKNIIESDRIKLKEPMSKHTTLHIGGEADYLVYPSSIQEIKDILLLCKDSNIPYYIMGNGSNLLVSDSGYRGLIIKLGNQFADIEVKEEGLVIAQAGVLMSKLSSVIAEHELTGFEFGAGIPGTLGGAVTMNAGAYGGEIKDCILSATVIDTEGKICTLDKTALQLEYRSSIIQKQNLCLLEAKMKFYKGEKQKILDKIHELNSLRRDKQPLEKYSAGSTFKRPEGYFAGKLISDAGLKGFQIGGAAVSDKHCGFLINKDNASAKDFIKLIGEVIRIVEAKYGVRLEPEVKFLGTFDMD